MKYLTMIWSSALLMAMLSTCAIAFVANPAAKRVQTRLFLEDRIANLIDQELYRQSHKDEREKQWMEKNRGAVMHSISGGYGYDHENLAMSFDENAEKFRQHKKDLVMAANDPERYCADRCVSTGNCDIFEDFYHLSPEQVLNFCEECVLSEEGECNLPQDFYDVGTLKP